MSIDQPEVSEADALEQRVPATAEPSEVDEELRGRGGDPRDRVFDVSNPVDPADAADQAHEIDTSYDEDH